MAHQTRRSAGESSAPMTLAEPGGRAALGPAELILTAEFTQLRAVPAERDEDVAESTRESGRSCMFLRCQSQDTTMVLIIRPDRVLCREHIVRLCEALGQPARYHVTWGIWTHAKVERDVARMLQPLPVAFGGEQPLTLAEAGMCPEPAELAWRDIDDLGSAIGGMRSAQGIPPVMNIERRHTIKT